jgi:hypothetical protein
MNERTIEAVDLGTEEVLKLSVDASMRLYVDDERVWSISAMGDGIVALTTGIRTVHISAADYWRLLHGATGPTTHAAGYLAARLAHVQSHATELLDALAQAGLIDQVRYPDVSRAVMFLRTALGMPEGAEAETHIEPRLYHNDTW